MTDIKVIAWDFDDVLTRNIADGCLNWAEDFEADIGQSREIFEGFIFGQDFDAILTGRQDLRDSVDTWSKSVGYAPGPDALLEYWFQKDASLDPMTLGLMDRIAQTDLRQVIATNNENRRTTYIENNLGFGARVEHIFASGRMGVAKPDTEYFRTVTTALKVDANEILFIDDLTENIVAAKAFGWQVMHFTDETRDKLEAICRFKSFSQAGLHTETNRRCWGQGQTELQSPDIPMFSTPGSLLSIQALIWQ